MGGLFGSLNSSLQALQAFEKALNVSQNNVSNSSTPGYARQTIQLEAQPFDIAGGQAGGVKAGAVQSTDNPYADQAVRDQLAQQGNYNAQSAALGNIQSLFDVSGQTGFIGALNNLFQSFSAWSATPSSAAAQQGVLTSAQAVAQSFQSTAASLSQTTTNLNQQIVSNVQQINTLAAAIQQDNVQIQQTNTPNIPDAGLQANLQANLQSLSQLADTTVTFAPNGTATVLLGGQTPLVIGSTLYSIQAGFTDPTPGANPGGVNNAHILNSSGQDITGQISQGSLAGLLTVRNTVLPSLQGNGAQQGALNQLAKSVADSVNSILTSAQTPTGAAGIPLFTYNNASPVDVAQTLALNPNITASTLAPSDPGPPVVSNGAALALSNLGESNNPAYQINGQSIVQFAAGAATLVGQQASDAQNGANLHTTLLTQAQALQTQISGVSLDQEAIQVMELQKGYQAAGKMVTVIDTLTNVLINMVT
jgi:flagellar hook-associated protein 1 FlgK